MPFVADTRCSYMRVSLNVNYIAELLEDILEMDFTIENKLYFYGYVVLLEDNFSSDYYDNSILNFADWFTDNYNDIYYYDTMVEKCFKKRE